MKMNEIELKENYIDNWLKIFFFHEELNIDWLKYHENIWMHDILDLSKSENEVEINEKELEIFDIIKIIF